MYLHIMYLHIMYLHIMYLHIMYLHIMCVHIIYLHWVISAFNNIFKKIIININYYIYMLFEKLYYLNSKYEYFICSFRLIANNYIYMNI